MNMKRDEFEAIVKRALELQSIQLIDEDEALTDQDLADTAQRLNIPPEIIHQAYLDVINTKKRYRFRGTPDEIRENFLRTFLLQNVHTPGKIMNLSVDRQALQIGKTSTIRVSDPAFPELDAEVTFTQDGPDHTMVSWTGNHSLSLRSKFFASLIPIVLFTIIFVAGGPLGLYFMPLGIALILLIIYREQHMRIDGVLTDYFEGLQLIDNQQEKFSAERELRELRTWKEQMSMNEPHAPSALPQMNHSSEEPENGSEDSTAEQARRSRESQ